MHSAQAKCERYWLDFLPCPVRSVHTETITFEVSNGRDATVRRLV